MELIALSIVVSVMAQLIALVVLYRTLKSQAARADVDHARRLEIDRNDRLRRAYGNLIKAADYLDRAFRDLQIFPTGHDYPATISASQQPPPDFRRFALVEDCTERARDLELEAAAVIVLDHENDPALRIYRDKVDYEYEDFRLDCLVYGPQADAADRLDKFVAAKKEMEAAARSRFPAPPN